MAKENHAPQEEDQILDTDIENEDDLDTEIDEDDDEGTADDDVDEDGKKLSPEQQIAKANAKANKYRRLLKKAKSGAASKPAAEKKPEPKPADQTAATDVDERILVSQGMDPELLKELKDVAALRKLPLIDAQKDPLFAAIKERHEKDKASKEASLAASRGSGKRNSGKKDFGTPNLSEEEHRKMVRDAS
jgi:hypothetical protein